MDGDGNLDAVVANVNQGNDIYLGAGDGTFSKVGSVDNGHGMGVELADFNNDGHLDIVIANRFGSPSLWINSGNATFSERDVTGSFDGSRVTVGDVNGDGNLDAVFANFSGGNRVYLGDGQGGLTSDGPVLGSAKTREAMLGDLDGDGDLDAFLTIEGANQVWLNADTDLRIEKTAGQTSVVQGENVTYTITVANDGPQGALGARVQDTFSALLENITWTAAFQGGATGNASGSGSIDELVDLPVDSQVTYTVTAKVVDPGTANLSSQSILTNNATVQAPAGMLDPPDNSSDTDSDIVLVAASPLVPPPLGVFVDSGQELGGGNSVPSALGDLDGDGDLDAFVVNYDIDNGDHGQSVVWINSGDGTFLEANRKLLPLPSGFSSQKSREAVLGDLDGDGDLDAVVINTFDNHAVWFNDGLGNFSEHQQLSNSNNVRGVDLGDLDGDGDLDAVVVYESGAVNEIWINQAGRFTLSTSTLGSDPAVHSNDIALGDLNGDGNLDAVVANIGGSDIYLGAGDGTFTQEGNALGSGHVNGVELADFNEDGRLDFITAKRFGSPSLWINNPDLTFSEVVLAGAFDSSRVTVGDVNGDGHLDAVFANFSNGNRVYLGDGQGGLTSDGPVLGSAKTREAMLGDLDGDGDLDAFLTIEGANQVWLNADTDLRIEKTAGQTSAVQGENVTYTITVTNDGPQGALGARARHVLRSAGEHRLDGGV